MNTFINTGRISYISENEKFFSFNISVPAKSAHTTGFYMRCSLYKSDWARELNLVEGMLVYVEGSISIYQYTNKEGVTINSPQLFINKIVEIGVPKTKNKKTEKRDEITKKGGCTQDLKNSDEIPF